MTIDLRGLSILFVILNHLGLRIPLHWLAVPEYTISRPGQSLPGAIWAGLGLHLSWYEGHKGYLPGNWDVRWRRPAARVSLVSADAAAVLAARCGG